MSRLDLADGLRLLESTDNEGAFGHNEHLAFAWAVLEEADDLDSAIGVVSMTIRHAAELAGNPDKFHLTMTVFWVRALDAVRRAHPDIASIEDALTVFPDLADPYLHQRHWTDINRDEARRTWVEPDLKPIP